MSTSTDVNNLKINQMSIAQYKTTTVSATEVYDLTPDIVDKLDGILDYYGTCITGAGAQTKFVVCPDFVLKTGASIRVKFNNYQNYNGQPNLNVNSTGAIPIITNTDAAAARYYWAGGEVVAFTYDGTNWVMEDGALATTTYYGVTKLETSTVSNSTGRSLTPRSLMYYIRDSLVKYPVYSATSTYAVGDRVRYSYNSWECNTAITTAEAWDATHWTALPTLQEQIDGKQATLVSGTNIKTINNESLLGSGNITIQGGGGSVAVDGTTISKNVSDELQAIAVKDNNNNAIKTWTGTKAQYDAITVKDSTTLYNITDDTDTTLALLNSIIASLNGKMDKDGFNATASVCVESYINGSSWYRVYSDGWCEQGGQSATPYGGNSTVTLLCQYTNTNYNVVMSGRESNNFASSLNSYDKTVFSFKVQAGYDGNWQAQAFSWQASGYIR